MKLTQPLPNVIQVTFPNIKEMALSVARAQEFYESAKPNIYRKYFSWAKFLDEHTLIDGNFDYLYNTCGVNIDGRVFTEWHKTFNDLTLRELAFMKEINAFRSSLYSPESPFYIIALQEGGPEDIRNHELAHALYSTNYDYKVEMNAAAISQLPHDVKDIMFLMLDSMGYHQNFYVDEIQAYLCSSDFEYMSVQFSMTRDAYDAITPKFIEIFSRYNYNFS